MAKNTSKSKEKSLPEKFKQFFGFKGSTPLNFDNLKIEPFHLTPHVLEDISQSNTVNNRLKSIKELYETVQTKPLEDHVIEILFYHTKDLVQPSICTETRHIVLQFYCFILQGQSEKMMIMRSVFFQFIKNHSIGEDISFRLEMLKRLSGSGTTITYFEEEIGSFLLECLPDMLFAHKTTEFLDLLVNIIKYNAAFLDDDIIAGYMKYICSHCGSSRLEEDIKMCLKVMDAVLCYSHLPSSVLQIFVFALCLTVNVEKLANDSWKVMRNLLGTNIGHTSIFTLCLFLQDKKNIDQPGVMCGAVFFLSMSLWGSKRVPTLIHPPSAVLPSIFMALKTNHHTVAFEVVSAVQRLVKKNDFTLETYTWEMILDIIEELLQYDELQKPGPPTSTLAISVHDFITATEEKISPYLKNRLYNIIENCSENRSVESVINLIKHRTQCIQPVKEDSLSHISNLLEKYFRNEMRPDVQLYVLETVVNIYMTKGYLQEDDAVAKMVLHELSHLENIQDVSVRKAVLTFLLQIAENCMTELFFDFLNVIEKAMNRPFDILKNEEMTNVYDLEKVFSDVVEAVSGLINVFEMKLHMLPSSHCAKAYEILVQHMQSHYDLLTYYEDSIQVRKKILELFFKIRSNSRKQVGLIVDGKVDCCVYVFCNTNEANEGILNTNLHPSLGSLPHMSFLTSSYISFEGMFQTLISCLKKEKDWTVLDFVLRNLPYLLQNKALILSGSFNINSLCSSLSFLLSEASEYPETLLNAPPNITRTEFQSSVFPVIASLPAYHNEMGSFMHRVLVRCLQSGLVSRSAKVCIEGLTLCTLEMQNVMIKYLPAVLEKLAKISATVAVSISVLEFLSNLIRLPQLYVSFVEDQYRSIFAIALPYTNPFKFSQFTVALAHHVIAMWFLKCRIPFRKEFAKFITKSLQNNMKVPYKKSLSESNIEVEDTVKKQTEVKFSSDNIKSTIELHSDLFEIGLDFMAKYTFGMSSNVPKRSSVADFLLEKGQKNSWMIGHKIITITTSGCASKAFKYGLCERCYASCHEISGSMESGDSTLAASNIHDPFEKKDAPVRNTFPSGRRRHMSSFQHRNIPLSDELESNRHAKDDILIHKQTFNSKRLERRNTSYSPRESSEYGLPVQETTEKNEIKDGSNQLCSCWCSGWAEIFIRRPTGNFSWMMKIQNKLFLPTCPLDLSLSAVSSLLLPVKLEISEKTTCDKISEKLEDSSEGNNDFEASEELDYSSVREATEAIKCPETSVPIRRANSSPDMSSGWANFENFKASQNSHIFVSEEFKHDNALKETCVDFKAMGDMGDNSSATVLDPFTSESCAKSTFSSKSAKRNPIGSDLKSEGDSNFAIGAFRDRGHTISVMSSNRASVLSSQYQEGKDMHRSGMNPSFVFLSLYHNNFFGPPEFRPIQLRCTEANTRALKVLDHIHPYDTHKIGVIYVGVGQVDNEVEILSNQFGSTRYVDFLRYLGNIVRLCDVDHEFTYVGGLDTKGSDGKFALVWHDDVMRVAFHVATLMPNKQSDPKKNNKKMHIGNDFVTIVYNESREDYNIGTIKGHVTTACVIIQPEDHNNNVVKLKLKTKELLEIFAHCGSYIVSDKSLPIFVRQMALHANLASLILDRRQQSAHISNWLERLRTIKRLRKKIIEEEARKEEDVQTSSKSNVFVDDFTDYV